MADDSPHLENEIVSPVINLRFQYFEPLRTGKPDMPHHLPSEQMLQQHLAIRGQQTVIGCGHSRFCNGKDLFEPARAPVFGDQHRKSRHAFSRLGGNRQHVAFHVALKGRNVSKESESGGAASLFNALFFV